ncbi:redox-sensitive transcriptional activator SoxR [Pseudaquabacterium pictum]|uniref:Redox-sensitive transcriptional activator SoxR n=1 Tax=Pseudaquabacterium pictum TaxID=2315236 RepID=A0A480AIW7_9BURK|nr:redox-sensitive transcriptional activator SoxR [Rubrivivax pictus]GCL61689.1 redox-sensitive transcriptional activator SoxR [Rubrivivax pictus]
MAASQALLSVGDLAARAGVAVSALHYYESLGLIQAERSGGNQRRYTRATLRRVAFIRAAQQLGIGLAEIGAALAGLPQQRTPTKADWARLSAGWRAGLEARIAALQALRDRLDGCIGCGCLSLRACALWNPSDQCGALGSGAQRLMQAPTAGRRAPKKKPGSGPG